LREGNILPDLLLNSPNKYSRTFFIPLPKFILSLA
jgi:hypothetical protein